MEEKEGREKGNAQTRKGAQEESELPGMPIVLIPDYSFASRAGLDNCSDGCFCRKCDVECESLWGYIGVLKMMGERCIKCGYTVWVDPLNGGLYDCRDREVIWKSTKELERTLSVLGVRVREVE